MPKMYTIKDLEALTNIKAHTLRIWEQRYNIVVPERTEGNTRRYTDQQLKKIMNVAFLNQHGVKISHIAKMDDRELNEKVKKFSETIAFKENVLVNELIEAIIKQDEDVIGSIFSQSMSAMGLERFMDTIIYKVFEKVGLLWQTGTIDITHEHFFSNIVRLKLIVAIEQLPKPQKENVFVLFLPNNEMHELGLLYYNYILRLQGFHVVYLGQTLPIEDLRHYNYIRRFQNLLTVVTSFISEKDLQKLVLSLRQTFQDVNVYLTGLQFKDKTIALPSNTFLFRNASELKELIKKIN